MQVEFYDNRYQNGYMESWDNSKINKVKEVLRSILLPSTGKALDFGCGNGIFTGIIKEVLPNWEVYGTDISETALDNAQRIYNNCTFFSLNQLSKYNEKFDLIFSHHVLEHVDYINDTIAQLNNIAANNAKQIHILPCGNEGSFEHSIAISVKNGIDIMKENRFFFEEPGHLRRLNTTDFQKKMSTFNFILENQFYSNQYWGAINWITKSSPRFVKKLTNLNNAVNKHSAAKLNSIRNKLLPLTYAQHALVLFLLNWNKFNRKPKDVILMIFFFIPALLSWPIYILLNILANMEWKKCKKDRKGSEMFLIFTR